MAEKLSGIKPTDTGRHPLNQLQDDIAAALMLPGEDDVPIVETTREVIEYYNRGNLAGFDKTGYFIMRDVMVCEKGKAEEVRARVAKDLKDVGSK